MKKYGLFCPIRKANPYRRMANALKTNNVAQNLPKPRPALKVQGIILRLKVVLLAVVQYNPLSFHP